MDSSSTGFVPCLKITSVCMCVCVHAKMHKTYTHTHIHTYIRMTNTKTYTHAHTVCVTMALNEYHLLMEHFVLPQSNILVQCVGEQLLKRNQTMSSSEHPIPVQ